MNGALADVTDFVLHRPIEHFPDSTLDAAAVFMLDTAGIAAASTNMQAGQIARQTAFTLYGSASQDHQAKMMFDGRVVSIAGAGYAAASQIDNLDGHDGYAPSKGHIGVVVLPTLAALMQHTPNMSGREAMACVAIGYEIAGRAAISLHASVSDYHTSGAWNGLGVAAIAARMRGQTPTQLRQSLGIAEYHGPRSQMMREIANPTMLHDGGGMGALVGLSAAIMAEQGFTGAPAITIEAADATSHWQDLGTFWQMENQYIKPYPTCRWAHGGLDAVKGLMAKHSLNKNDIAKIEINTFHQAACLYPGMPDTTSKAQYSLGFAIAALVEKGMVGLEQISGDGLTDKGVAATLSKISIAEDPRHTERFPQGRWADATITTSNGKRLSSGDVNASGGPENPLSLDQIKDKYRAFATPTLGQTRAEDILEALLGMTAQNAKLSDFGDLLHRPV